MRYDVYRNIGGAGFLLNIQSDLLDVLNTRVVVPLLPSSEAPLPAARLNPVIVVDGANHVMVTQYMAAIPLATLGEPVGNLLPHHDQIAAALDMLFQGF